MNKGQILFDIETIYQNAIEQKKWHVALRAKEIQGKILGLFKEKTLPNITRIRDMDEYQLTEFLERLEKRTPSLKHLELPKI